MCPGNTALSMNRKIIGISGGSGSGKSAFIKDLKEKFSSDRVAFLSQDNYYKPRTEQKKDLQGVRNFDLPSSIDLDGFTKDLVRLKSGINIEKMEYTFNNPQATPGWITVKSAPVIIVEGLFIFSHQPIWDLLNLRVFINASDSLRLSRRIIRDQMERNYPLEDVLYRYENHVFPAYKAFIAPYYDKVDVIINNFTNYQAGLQVLENHIQCVISANQ